MAGESRVEADERGARQITALLPNGRTVWFRTAEPLAQESSLHRLAQIAERASDRHEAGHLYHTGAIRRLSTSIAADSSWVDARQLRRARRLRRQILAADQRLDLRLPKARDELRKRLDEQLKVDEENVRRLRRRDMWDKILIAASLPLFSAYGQRGNLLGSHNLTLVASLLIWLMGDHVVEAVFGPKSKSRYAMDDADAWSYLAPIGSVLAGWWLLGDRQHQRFVTGVTAVAAADDNARTLASGGLLYRCSVRVDLRERIGPDHVADFEGFTGVPAVATLGALRFSTVAQGLDPRVERLSARVNQGVLNIRFRVVTSKTPPGAPPDSLGDLDVAWMVDTRKPAAATPS